MNESTIQKTICRASSRQGNILIGNYRPQQWFECDVFELTKDGFFHEYEIKRTWDDFKADEKKGKKLAFTWMSKHSLLSRKAMFGPSKFWFVIPKGTDVSRCPWMYRPRHQWNSSTVDFVARLIPKWAGLIVIEADKDWRNFLPVERVVVDAPILHTEQVTDHFRECVEKRTASKL